MKSSQKLAKPHSTITDHLEILKGKTYTYRNNKYTILEINTDKKGVYLDIKYENGKKGKMYLSSALRNKDKETKSATEIRLKEFMESTAIRNDPCNCVHFPRNFDNIPIAQ